MIVIFFNDSRYYIDETDTCKRQWIFLENVGGILNPLLKLIFNSHLCKECHETIYSLETFSNHLCKGSTNPTYEFDWLIPQMELLHYEMNAGKSLFSLCWDVFLKKLCKELRIVSQNAQAYAKKGSDHHKMWDIIEICYIPFTHEIICQFLKYCKVNKLIISIFFIQQMVFNFLHGLILFCKGTQASNREYIYAVKNKLSLLSFGCNHPHYHYLILQEKRTEALMPEKIKSLKLSPLVLNLIQRIGHYQSGDAGIEEVSKEAKRNLVDVPNETQWKHSFRNFDNMNVIRTSTFADVLR